MGESYYSTEPWVQEFPRWRNSHPLNLNSQIYTMTHKQRPSVPFHRFSLNSAKLCFVLLSKCDNVSFIPVDFLTILFTLSGERYKSSVGRASAECDRTNCNIIVYSWWGQKLSLHGLKMLLVRKHCVRSRSQSRAQNFSWHVLTITLGFHTLFILDFNAFSFCVKCA